VAVGNDPPLDVELVEFLLDFRDPFEGLKQHPVGLIAERRVIDLDVSSMRCGNRSAIDVQNVQALLEKRDRGQEILALETVLVQLVG